MRRLAVGQFTVEKAISLDELEALAHTPASRNVLLPIETALAGLPNSIRLFSHTQFGLSFNVITYDDAANVNLVRQQVNERLRSVDLPEGVLANIAPNATPVGCELDPVTDGIFRADSTNEKAPDIPSDNFFCGESATCAPMRRMPRTRLIAVRRPS